MKVLLNSSVVPMFKAIIFHSFVNFCTLIHGIKLWACWKLVDMLEVVFNNSIKIYNAKQVYILNNRIILSKIWAEN